MLPFLQNRIFRFLTIGMLVIVSGFALLIYMIIHNERQNVLEERVRASELMAAPILQSIYEDMEGGPCALPHRQAEDRARG
jgi:K+ transporter